jgi:hypothetical protein
MVLEQLLLLTESHLMEFEVLELSADPAKDEWWSANADDIATMPDRR